MNRYLRSLKYLFTHTFAHWNKVEAPHMGAALSTYTAFSLAPLLVLLVGSLDLIFHSDGLRYSIVKEVSVIGGASIGDFLSSVLTNTETHKAKSVIVSLISFIILVAGAMGVLYELKGSLDKIFEAKAKTASGVWGFMRGRLLSLSMLPALSFLLLVSFVVSAGLSIVEKYWSGMIGITIIGTVINALLAVGVSTLLFWYMYKVIPDKKLPRRAIFIGAFVTALLFLIGKFILGFYLTSVAADSPYGAAGAIVIFLLWIYYSTLIFFFGASLTYVLAKEGKHH